MQIVFLSLSCAKKVINYWKRFQYNEICKKKEGINMFTEDHIFLSDIQFYQYILFQSICFLLGARKLKTALL